MTSDTPATLLARIAVEVTGQTDEAAWLRFFELYGNSLATRQERKK